MERGFGLESGFILLLQCFYTIPVSGAAAIFHGSQSTTTLLRLLLPLFWYLELLPGIWNCHSLRVELALQHGLHLQLQVESYLSLSPVPRWSQTYHKADTHFHKLFPLSCALPWIYASTNRLPRNFHIVSPGKAIFRNMAS
jgi:hypothetical protein